MALGGKASVGKFFRGKLPRAGEWTRFEIKQEKEGSRYMSRWREALYTAAQQLSQDMPNSGMFMSNCAHHVTLANPTTWSAMPVPTIDSNDQTSVTLNQVLSNWLKDTRPFQALDGPTTRNPSCPYDD